MIRFPRSTISRTSRSAGSVSHFRPLLQPLEDRTAPASFQGLGDLTGGDYFSQGRAVSANGLVVIGGSTSSSGHEAFRWTEATGLVGLSDLPGGPFQSGALGLSADGSVVVGSGNLNYPAIGSEAFRWTTNNGMVSLGDLPGGTFDSSAHAVSADGSIVVGRGHSTLGEEAFRWTEATGIIGLGDLPGGLFQSYANGVSADGSVVVGLGYGNSGNEGFRWTGAGGMVGLGNLPGGNYSDAYNVSGDGSVIVGLAQSASGSLACRWTSAEGWVSLGELPGGTVSGYAYATSANGSVIVGESNTDSGYQAFRWTKSNGMRNLRNMLAGDYGLASQLAGWTLNYAISTSADGRALVGIGTNPESQSEAWIARLGTPPRVQSMQVNDGAAQRSRLTSITITFDQLVNLPANPATAFQLIRQSDNAPVPLHASVVGNAVSLTFNPGTTVEFGSLTDGRYTLTVLAGQVNGGNFDGNGDGTDGDDYILTGAPANGLFRLYGDITGDSSVNASDFIQFRLGFGGVNDALDFDVDGAVSANDFIQFRLRFGAST